MPVFAYSVRMSITSGPIVPVQDRKRDGRRAVGELERGSAVGHRASFGVRADHGRRLRVAGSEAAAAAIGGARRAAQRRVARASARPADQIPQRVVGSCRAARRASQCRPRSASRPHASRKRARTRSFSSMPRRQRQRMRFSRRSSIVMARCLASSPRSRAQSAFIRVLTRDHTVRFTIRSLILLDRQRRVEVLRTDVDAIHDRVAAEQPIRILEVVEALR